MLLYLKIYMSKYLQDIDNMKYSLSEKGVKEAVKQGALRRLRPIIMTVATIFAGLLPIMLGGGTGSEVMRRIAAPMVGGMLSATVLALLVIPAVFLLRYRPKAGRETA